MRETSTTRLLTSSYYPADQSVPLLERSVGEALLAAAEESGDAIALVDGQVDRGARRSWTFSQLAEDAQKVARGLLKHFEPGQHVALWASNSPEWVLIEYGAALAGLVLVTVNPAYLAQELKRVLRQSQARGVIVQDSYRGRNLCEVLATARADLPDLQMAIPLSSWNDFMLSGGSHPLPHVAPDAIAQLQYTSGTTGFPKGACLTHRGLSNNSRLYAQTIGASKGDVWINAMPMFHTAGCGLATLGALQTGGTQVMAPDFDASHMLDLFEQQRGTVMICVPTMLIRMLEEQTRAPRDISSWRLVTLGGAPVPPELVRAAEEKLGVQVAIGFGQTEASPYLTHTVVNDPNPKWFETVGKPLPQTEIKIVDPVTDELAALGASGEICGRGYGIMAGYYNAPEATRSAIDADGWLHTGDIGSMDERGYCRVLGRLRDMIIRGGENIYPREVEDVLMTHPALIDVAVIGLPDPAWGESVAACVRSRAKVESAELEAFCRGRLASFKIPRSWHFMESFPQTASGKVQKFALRELLLESSKTRAGKPA